MILHVTDYYRPRVGGVEEQIEQLANAQHATGQDVAVLAYTPASPNVPDAGGFAVHRIPTVWPRGMAPHPGVLTRVRPLLDRLDPTVVHAHFSCVSPAAWAGAWWALGRQVPVVATVHSLWDRRTRVGHRVSGSLLGWGHRLPMTAVSTVCARHVRQALPDADVTVIPNGIHLEQWQPTTEPATLDAVHVVSVGRLVPWRQPMLLLDVLRRARAQLAPTQALRATIVGPGPLSAVMARYLRDHGMDSWVELTGHLESQDIRRLLATADIYLNASTREAFGIATLEARTAGLPVVAFSTTGVRDYVRHGYEGLLAPDSEGLVAELVRLCGDTALRHRIAGLNRSTDASHSAWPAVLDAFQRRYEEAAGRPPSPRADSRPQVPATTRPRESSFTDDPR